MNNHLRKKLILYLLTFFTLPLVWLRHGFDSIYLDLDFARDLYELSNIWLGKIVWQGPALMAGFNITPLFYYLFYPAILISRGNALAIVLFNVFLSALSLIWLAWLGIKKHGYIFLLIVLCIGLCPWWQEISIYVGNGFTYSIFLLFSLISMWYAKPLWLSSILLGIAISFHPAAIFALPILIYFLIKKGRISNYFIAILALILPWIPYIVFTILTKGYWLRSWFNKPSISVVATFDFAKNINNLWTLIHLTGIPIIIFFLLWILIWFFNKNTKFRVWYGIANFGITFFLFMQPVPDRYLYGLLAIICFILVHGIIKLPKRMYILLLIIVILLIKTYQTKPVNIDRSIPIMLQNINFLIDNKLVGKNQKIALLTALKGNVHTPPGGIAPQSNDYRYFLRVKGYNAIEVLQYAEADVLIMFIEDDNFDWKAWNCWETDAFGKKQVRLQQKVNNTNVIIFDKSKDNL